MPDPVSPPITFVLKSSLIGNTHFQASCAVGPNRTTYFVYEHLESGHSQILTTDGYIQQSLKDLDLFEEFPDEEETGPGELFPDNNVFPEDTLFPS